MCTGRTRVSLAVVWCVLAGACADEDTSKADAASDAIAPADVSVVDAPPIDDAAPADTRPADGQPTDAPHPADTAATDATVPVKCGSSACGPGSFCCGPPECGFCAPDNSGVYCPPACPDAGPSLPPCVEALIKQLQSEPVANPPASLTRYSYNGTVGYYQPPRCCDIPGVFYDSECNVVCSPDGGITGMGDGKCPDFFSVAIDQGVVWQDPR